MSLCPTIKLSLVKYYCVWRPDSLHPDWGHHQKTDRPTHWGWQKEKKRRKLNFGDDTHLGFSATSSEGSHPESNSSSSALPASHPPTSNPRGKEEEKKRGTDEI